MPVAGLHSGPESDEQSGLLFAPDQRSIPGVQRFEPTQAASLAQRLPDALRWVD